MTFDRSDYSPDNIPAASGATAEKEKEYSLEAPKYQLLYNWRK
jgi:hypothetical protein